MNHKLTKQDAQELLRRYRLGQCTQREIEIIEHWYYTFEHDEDDEINVLDNDDLHDLKLEMHHAISQRISAAEESSAEAMEPAGEQRFLSWRNLTRIAAALFVGVSAVIFLYSYDWRFGEDKRISSLSDSRSTYQQEVVTPASSKVIYLADGTVVWLRGDSKLEHPPVFSGVTREVSLVGEAFFDVAPDRKKPFIIHASNFTTRVVGTSFNIKAYSDDESQEVVVVTGKVVVSLNDASPSKVKELVLRPNQKAVYSKRSNSLASVIEKSATAEALKRDKLDFDEARLEDIVNVLSANYNVYITLKNEAMKNCVITADLSNENLELGIIILAKAMNASYTMDGREIILDGTGCGAQP